MNGCPSGFQNIQLIEPDVTLPTVTLPPPGNDPGVVEAGNVILTADIGVVSVSFAAMKLGDYRFEYLYVDALGLTNPGIIDVVPVTQNLFGFTVNLAGVPIADGYILRWKVAVVSVTGQVLVDAPESFRVQMPNLTPGTIPTPLPPEIITMDVTFQNPRSNTNYGFSELRVENLVDTLFADQSVIGIQVVQKSVTGFKIMFRPVPPTPNYYLVGRTP